MDSHQPFLLLSGQTWCAGLSLAALRRANPMPNFPSLLAGALTSNDTIFLLKIMPFSSFIYSTNLDVSHVKVCCSQRCSVCFHPACFLKTRKNLPKNKCATPDCDGVVINVFHH